MAMPEMEEVKDLALKYPKNILGRMAQLGQISSTLAVMAGMMRDRIVQSEMKPPEKTVSEDIMGLEGFSDPTAPQQPTQTAPQQPVMQRGGGLTRIPVRSSMYDMAGGGIVAFQAGGDPRARARTPSRATMDPRARPGSVPPSAVRQAKILMQSRPGLSLKGALKLLGFPIGVLATGYELTEGLMSTDKGGITDIPPTAGYDYSAEEAAGGLPSIPTESIGERGETAGFMDYLRAARLAPREQVMDPTTGKYVDVPQKPLYQSVTPGLAGVLDGESRPQTEAQAARFDPMAGVDMAEIPTMAAAAAAAAKKPSSGGAQQAAAQQAAVQQAAASKPTLEDLQKAAAAKPFDLAGEAKRIADTRKQFLGEDPYTKYLTEQLEKSGKEGFTDRALEALQMIQVGNLMREGKTTGEEGISRLGQTRLAKKQAQEARLEKIAQLKGREYESRAKDFEAAAAQERELAKETRAEQRKTKETKEDRTFRKELVELQARLRPKDFNTMLFERYEKGSPEQRKIIEDFQKAGKVGTQLTANQLANIRDKAITNAEKALMFDPRYTQAKSAEERAKVKKIIEEEEMTKLLGDVGYGNAPTGFTPSAQQQSILSKYQ